MSHRVTRSILIALLAVLLVPLSATSAQAATGTITGVAVDAAGKPLPNVGWEVYTWRDGGWQSTNRGPNLTDDRGRFTYGSIVGEQYRVCFYDTYYGQTSSDDYWQPEVRHRDVCWPNASSHLTAQTWTSTAAAPSKTFTMTLQQQGLGMAPVDPFIVGTFETGKPLTIIGQEGWRPTNAAFSYQWMSQAGSAPAAPIAGATSSTFTPTAGQTDHNVFAKVTVTRAGYKPVTLATQVSKAGGTLHVQPTTPLRVTGAAKSGSTLTASFGKPAATYSEITWYVDGVPQPASTTYDGATSTFRITALHAGSRIDARLKVYSRDVEGNHVPGSDSYHRVLVQVAGSRPAQPLAVVPAMAGQAAVGRVLSAPKVTADPNATVKYQWMRGTAKI